MSIECKFTDNSDDFLKELKKRMDPTLEEIGLNAERFAKTNIRDAKRVDTGLMRNSVTWAIAGKQAAIPSYNADVGEGSGTYSGVSAEDESPAVFVGSNVEYAPYNEIGTVKMTGIHFLKRAVTEHADTYKKIVDKHMSGKT